MRFFGFKIKKTTVFESLSPIRVFYQSEPMIRNSFVHFVEGIYKKELSKKELHLLFSQEKKEFLDSIDHLFGEAFIRIYDYDSEHYIGEVLENNYTFLNHYSKLNWDIEPCFYVSGEEDFESNDDIARWVSDQDKKNAFFLYPLRTKADFDEWLYQEWTSIRQK